MGLGFDENIKILDVKLSLLCPIYVPAFSSYSLQGSQSVTGWISREQNPSDGDFRAGGCLDQSSREGTESGVQQKHD